MKRQSNFRSMAAFLLALTLGQGCKPDSPSPSPPAQTEEVRFAGILQDREGHALVGKVTVNQTSAASSGDGSFALSVPRAEKYVISAWASGHLIHSEVYAGPGRDNMKPLLKPAEIFTFDAAKPLNQEDSRGTSVQLPADALVDANGHPPSGPVSMSMHTYDLLTEQMVGDMSALDSNGKPVVLRSLGAVSVEFSDEQGTAYNLAPGKKATLSLKTPPGNDFEGSVPLWWFDTEQGLWREEGTATVKDGVATGEVGHFTVWNVDAKFNDSSCVRIQVDPVWFTSQGYSFRNPLLVEARVTSSWTQYIQLEIDDAEQPHVLYNMENNVPVEIRVAGKPYAIIDSGDAWGDVGYPPAPYSVCKGQALINGTPTSLVNLEGDVFLQHRPSYYSSKIKVEVVLGSERFSTFAESTGHFSLLTPAGQATVTASMQGYLSARRDNVSLVTGATTTLPPSRLLAGNVDRDATNCVTTLDTASIIAGIDSYTSYWTDWRDIDGNKFIDFADLALAAENGGKCGPTAW